MQNQIIVPDQGPLLIEDSSCPVREKGKVNGIFKDVRDAELATGIPKADIVSMADNRSPARNGYLFVWPSVKEIQAIWNYTVAKAKLTDSKPVTVEVVLAAAPGARTGERLYYKSITSCLRAWDLTPAVFNAIVGQRPGWRKLLPKMLRSIKTKVELPLDQATRAISVIPDTKLFSLHRNKEGISMRLASQGPLKFGSVQEVPEGVLNYCSWSG